MTSWLMLYAWTIPAGGVFAAALALLGAQIAARDRVIQTFCVSQGAMTGVLLALGLFPQDLHRDPHVHVLPFVFSLLTSALVYLLTEALSRIGEASRQSVYSSVFTLLLSASYLITVFFPLLESHLSGVFFGDLATLTRVDAMFTLGLGGVLLVFLWVGWRSFSDASFETSVYGEGVSRLLRRGGTRAFRILSLVTICYSVQFLGFLFTMVAMFLPTTLLLFGTPRGVRLHLFLSGIVAFLGTVVGFLVSLYAPRLPTVPTIAFAVVAVAASAVAVSRLSGRKSEKLRQPRRSPFH